MEKPSWQALSDANAGGLPAAYTGHPAPETPPRVAPRYRDTNKNAERRRTAQGLHPRTALPLRAAGGRCGTCGHCVAVPVTANGRDGPTTIHHKCALTKGTWGNGRASDVLLRWPACEGYKPAPRTPKKGKQP